MTMGAADEELAGDQQREVTQRRSQDFSEGVSQEPRQQRRGFVGCARQCDERACMLAVPRPSPSTVSNARAQIRTHSIAREGGRRPGKQMHGIKNIRPHYATTHASC